MKHQIYRLLTWIKNRFYFVLAWYFRFWATISLRRWSPKVIVVTGSSGKTTLLHMLEAQLGGKAHISHRANSTFGIPFDILGLSGIEGSRLRWFALLIKAPWRGLTYKRRQPMYVAEVDAERPGEAPFLGSLLKPEVTLWISLSRTHSQYYDKSVKKGKFETVEDAIAHEYGELARDTKQLVIVNGDNPRMVEEVEAAKARVRTIEMEQHMRRYRLDQRLTEITLSNGAKYKLPQPIPKEAFYQIAMLDETLRFLGEEPDYKFNKYVAPPGRSSAFKGKKGIRIIDSTYNANLSSISAVLEMFKDYPGKHKWLVIGDMLEQGEGEEIEHRRLAHLLADMMAERYILLGTRVKQYTDPELRELVDSGVPVDSFEDPRDTLDFIKQHISGSETILFKGARFFEGIIEHLLKRKRDIAKLPRQTEVWKKRRQQWGL